MSCAAKPRYQAASRASMRAAIPTHQQEVPSLVVHIKNPSTQSLSLVQSTEGTLYADGSIRVCSYYTHLCAMQNRRCEGERDS